MVGKGSTWKPNFKDLSYRMEKAIIKSVGIMRVPKRVGADNL